jgi:phage-related protein
MLQLKLTKKKVLIDRRALKEINKFPREVEQEISSMIKILEDTGRLSEPCAKKIRGKLFEIRINHRGQWRVLYYYCFDSLIIALSAFKKTQQKTPLKEIKKAENRLKEYI